MSNKTILLSGVHGVGKGFYLQNTFSPHKDFTILEASKLIGQYKKADDAGYKKVIDISNNQQILLAALKTEQSKISGNIILDGHLCILNAYGNIENIPEYFFEKASICGVVLLQDDPQKIVVRQTKRDGLKLQYETVKLLQEKETEYCKVLFSKYALPYNIISHNCSYQEFLDITNKM